VSARWVAGAARARLLCRHRVGIAGARALAAASGPEAAVAALADSPYGRDVRAGMPVTDARRAVGAVCLWHLRVLAGWLPPRAGGVVRVFAARFELANIGDRLAALDGVPVGAPYELGSLSVAWPRVARASTRDGVRAALAASAWGNPGPVEWPLAEPVLEARWSSWLAATDAGTSTWAAGAAALVAARRLVAREPVPPAALADLRRQLGTGWERAVDLDDLAARLPRSGSWVLDGLVDPRDLWRAEGAWWRRVDHDAAATLRTGRPGPATAAAAAARLVADARWTQAALEASAWGSAGLEAFDAVA
jgi:hypothetical protein